MRVLHANKFFYPRGGAERYFLDLMDLLPSKGHAAAPFSMHHPRNLSHDLDRYFVSHVNYAAEAGPLGALAAAARSVYNRETRKRVRALVREFRPDVAHLHNFHHQLSGSLIDALDAEGVPIVQTLHDYQWVCPVYTFVRQGRVCEDCKGSKFHLAVRHRCHSGSIPRSAVAALELKVGQWRGWPGRVRRFLAPSNFLGRKVVEHGLNDERVYQQDYCLRMDAYRPRGEHGRHALYVGRLSREKGVETLVNSLADVPGLTLQIAGTGPLEPDLRQLVESRVPDRVRFLGFLEGEDLHRAIAQAAFVVVPSEWYENQPFAVLESFALETPVLGARIGGIPELVVPDETGMLFTSGSVADLTRALTDMARREDHRDMGRRARRFVEERFDPDRHMESLLTHYREVIG